MWFPNNYQNHVTPPSALLGSALTFRSRHEAIQALSLTPSPRVGFAFVLESGHVGSNRFEPLDIPNLNPWPWHVYILREPVAVVTVLLVLATFVLALVPVTLERAKRRATRQQVCGILEVFEAVLRGLSLNVGEVPELGRSGLAVLMTGLFTIDVASALGRRELAQLYK